MTDPRSRSAETDVMCFHVVHVVDFVDFRIDSCSVKFAVALAAFPSNSDAERNTARDEKA